MENNEEIRFLATNLEFTGTEYTKDEKGAMKLDKFTIEIKGYKITFKQLEGSEDLIKKLKKNKGNGGAFTVEIIVKTSLKNHKEVKEIVEDLCWLLSFAKGVDIIPSQEFHFKDGERVWFHGESIGHRHFKRDFIIPELPPEILVNFLKETYPNFIKYKENLGLSVLFNLYVSMKSAFYMEMRCVTGYVLLETLSDKLQGYYESMGNPIKKSNIWTLESFKRKLLPSNHNLSDEDIQKIINKMSYPHPTLQDSIERIRKDFKFKYKDGDLKLFEYRKYFIHKGRFPPDVNFGQLYNTLIHFIDRILLSILQYTGEYCDTRKRYQLTDMKYE